MTHTEESLMALARALAWAADWGYPLDKNTQPELVAAEQALRLAIREVLAERDELRVKRNAILVSIRRGLKDDIKRQRERAEKAEAECERLNGLLRRYRTEVPLGHQPHMIAHEVDAALKDQP